ncbi:hypothetical protein M6D93_17010 [Jatrophihabitans telluris]|uniref:IrrE N-terminal-like domain-containing protein n=1 Tax=Jatrophihabitans telluris TaxID=2038343 RepID=A0ABY4QWY4_9ACTN|nr:ImmA/IrrE family metallo-endopeptidase [Jatrophihabitans telluris]UQX87983.1 hypothetical protein M6D93_17010 [Jatrophihabitans telluris]
MTNAPTYDPWQDLARNWPGVEALIEPLEDDLLGEIREFRDGRLQITLRANTTSGQRRCTLAHEIVHLERGLDDCGPWQSREESAVHEEVARRLIGLNALIDAARYTGDDHAALAAALDVDQETLQLRLGLLTSAERRRLRRLTAHAGGHSSET